MAILDFEILKNIKMSDEDIKSLYARMTLRELKDFRFDDGKGNLNKLTKKVIFNKLNETLILNDMLPVTKYWFDKWWRLLK